MLKNALKIGVIYALMSLGNNRLQKGNVDFWKEKNKESSPA